MPGRTGTSRTAAEPHPGVVEAAGAITWRPAAHDRAEVLLVHRPKYDDWSFPKGKLHAGEQAPAAAVREVLEESGIRIRLGLPLPAVRYPLAGGAEKVVRYWAAASLHPPDAGDPPFEPNREVDERAWFGLREAAHQLTHARDRALLTKLPLHETTTLVIARHAQALSRRRVAGPGPRTAAGRGRRRPGRAADLRPRRVRDQKAGLLRRPALHRHPAPVRPPVQPRGRGRCRLQRGRRARSRPRAHGPAAGHDRTDGPVHPPAHPADRVRGARHRTRGRGAGAGRAPRRPSGSASAAPAGRARTPVSRLSRVTHLLSRVSPAPRASRAQRQRRPAQGDSLAVPRFLSRTTSKQARPGAEVTLPRGLLEVRRSPSRTTSGNPPRPTRTAILLEVPRPQARTDLQQPRRPGRTTPRLP